jgi:subfamily B ATP-binding cassette protein MsbA
VKLFGLSEELFDSFTDSIEQYTRSTIDLDRNKAAIQNFYDLAAALTLFSLIYVGFVYSGLSLGGLGIFLLAMFRLAPLVSRLNSQIYNVEGYLSHLVRTHAFIDDLDNRSEDPGSKSVSNVTRIEFDDVDFSYDSDEHVLKELSFAVERGEFIGFVGQSGAGKSTIVSLPGSTSPIAARFEPMASRYRSTNSPSGDLGSQSYVNSRSFSTIRSAEISRLATGMRRELMSNVSVRSLK